MLRENVSARAELRRLRRWFGILVLIFSIAGVWIAVGGIQGDRYLFPAGIAVVLAPVILVFAMYRSSRRGTIHPMSFREFLKESVLPVIKGQF